MDSVTRGVWVYIDRFLVRGVVNLRRRLFFPAIRIFLQLVFHRCFWRTVPFSVHVRENHLYRGYRQIIGIDYHQSLRTPDGSRRTRGEEYL